MLSKSCSRRKPLEGHAGEQPRIFLTLVRLPAAELVRPAGRDGTNQELEIELVGRELAGQLVEQLGMTGGIVGGEIVDRVDDPDPEKMSPQAIDGRAGEIGVAVGNHPVGQDAARAVAEFELGLRPSR